MESKRVPEIRFEGFVDEWEERKLGEIFNETFNYVNPKEANLELWSVTAENGLTPKTKRFDRTALVKKNDKFKKVSPGDIVYNPMNITIGSVGFNNTNYCIAVSGYYVIMTLAENYSDSYFSAWLPSQAAIRLYKQHATGSLLEKQRVQFSTFSLIQVMLPSFDEQKTIGHFFEQIKSTIKFQQRSIENLKTKKKGLLQKMFPKEGEKVPELRFPGFTGEWTSCKLGEIAIITMGQSPSSEYYMTESNLSNHILVQGNADMKNGHVVPRIWTSQVTKMAEEGALILSVRAPVGDIGKTGYKVVLGRGVAAVEGENNEFLFQKFEKMKQEGFWNRVSTGSTFESINATDIKEAIVELPNETEQQKIGQFFKQLDDKIALEERELKLLQETKKAFLQKMFV